jgi:hypothetical protein
MQLDRTYATVVGNGRGSRVVGNGRGSIHGKQRFFHKTSTVRKTTLMDHMPQPAVGGVHNMTSSEEIVSEKP